MTTTLAAVGLGVRAGQRALLDDVGLHAAGGTIVVVVGENGAGKTTLLDCLAGVRAPTTGRVLLGETPLASLEPRERARRLATLAQGNALADDMTAAARIAQGLIPRRGAHALVDDVALRAVEGVARELGVDALLGRRVGALSGGERRRVEVARALVDERALGYVLDEPHAGVDARHTSLISAALRARAARGALVVVSLHDLGAALALADRVVGLRAGRVVVEGAPGAVMTRDALARLYGVAGEIVTSSTGARAVVLDDGNPRGESTG